MMKSRSEYLSEALKRLVPDAEWATVGDEIQWFDDAIEQPSINEIEIEIQSIKDDEKNSEYKSLRRMEYPPIEDFIDAYYWEKNGDNSLMEEYLKKVSAVKNKFPK